jgi:glycosyltransferase involved in cell wall biosynthesis
MRFGQVISEMGVGGAERVVVELLRDGAERGDALGLLANPGRLDAEIENLPIERVALPTARKAPDLLRAAAAARRFTASFKPDLLHAHNVRVAGLARIGSQLAKPLSRPPVLATYHGVPLEEINGAARVLRHADAVVCVSAGLLEQLAERGVPAERLSVIANGVPDAPALSDVRRAEIDAELELEPGAPVVAVIGRLVPQKAHDRFFRAAVLVKETLPGARFLIVGDGELRTELEAMVAELGLVEQVRFTGIRDDVPELIGRTDLVVFSSIWEGLSIVALEALAAGVPLVSTDVAGTRELLATGAGLVVPHDDERLAGAITELLGDPARRQEMGAAGRALHAERFSTAQMAAAYRERYEALLS